MVSSAMPKASADWAKKAVVFLAVGLWDSMPQPSPEPRGPGIRTDTQFPATLPPVSSWTSPAAVAVESRLFGALAVLRVVVLVNAVALNIYRADSFQRPVAGAVCVGVMVLWTGFAIWAYGEPRRRTFLLLAADLALAVALLLVTPLVKGAGFSASLPGFWV